MHYNCIKKLPKFSIIVNNGGRECCCVAAQAPRALLPRCTYLLLLVSDFASLLYIGLNQDLTMLRQPATPGPDHAQAACHIMT